MIAFILWTLFSLLFIGLGIHCLLAKKTIGFWANAKQFEVTDVKAYNRALAKLWFAYGFFFFLFGLPLLAGQNVALIFIPIIGVALESITAMIVFTIVIDPKYRKRN